MANPSDLPGISGVRAICALLLTSLGGCVGGGQRDSQRSLHIPPPSDHGVVVGSVTAPTADHYHEVAVFEIRAIETGATRIITSGTTVPIVYRGTPPCEREGMQEHCGRLFALDLPAGDYVVDRFRMMGNPEGWILLKTPVAFTIRDQETRYLGNLQARYCQGMPLSTRGAILGVDLRVEDQWSRDGPLLVSQFPWLADQDVTKGAGSMDLGRWRVDYEPFDWGNCD